MSALCTDNHSLLSVIRCTAPPIPPHASSNQIQIIYNYDDIIDYTCDTGYVVLSGNVSRVCLEDGNWSGDPISCSSEYVTHCKIIPTFNDPGENRYRWRKPLQKTFREKATMLKKAFPSFQQYFLPFLTHNHTIPHFDALKTDLYSCGKHCEKRRKCM